MSDLCEIYETASPETREAAVLEALRREREIDPSDFVDSLIKWARRCGSSVIAADVLAIASLWYLGGADNGKFAPAIRQLHREIEDVWRWSTEVAA